MYVWFSGMVNERERKFNIQGHHRRWQNLVTAKISRIFFQSVIVGNLLKRFIPTQAACFSPQHFRPTSTLKISFNISGKNSTCLLSLSPWHRFGPFSRRSVVINLLTPFSYQSDIFYDLNSYRNDQSPCILAVLSENHNFTGVCWML